MLKSSDARDHFNVTGVRQTKPFSKLCTQMYNPVMREIYKFVLKKPEIQSH